jgi:PAS domain S-box-containing protein
VETLDTNAGREIRAELDRLSKPASHTSLPILIAHGRLIVDVLPRVDAMLHEIINARTTTLARDLDMALARSAEGVEIRAQRFRYALYFFSLVLLAFLVRQLALRRAAAMEVLASERRYRAITEFANEAIISTDSAGRIVSWNIGAQTIFGYQAHEAMGMPVSKMMPAALRESQTQRFEQWVLKGALVVGTEAVESIGLRKDGTEFPLELTRSAWTTEQGSFESGIIREITLRKELEARTRQQEIQLIQANKMTSLGLLVSGVSHELGGAMQVINANAAILENSWKDAFPVLDEHHRENADYKLAGLAYMAMRDALPKLTQAIHAGVQRIDQFSKSLRNFAKPHAHASRVEYRINDTVLGAVNILKPLISNKTSHFNLELAQALPPISGDEGQVQQVLINLIVNALEALPDKSGAIRVATSFEPEGKRVVIHVDDQGKGMTPEHLARIFDPFFTTKASTGGTGLGLAICASLVNAQGGTLDITSAVGNGTCAVLTLPAQGAQ